MLIGYARVSTPAQHLDLQVAALKLAGCHQVFNDKIGGSRFERPGLTKALKILRSGNSWVVWKLDRLGRSVSKVAKIAPLLFKPQAQLGTSFSSDIDGKVAEDSPTPSILLCKKDKYDRIQVAEILQTHKKNSSKEDKYILLARH